MNRETRIELTKGVISTADALLKWSFILNGASAAGLLTFLGNTIDKQTSFSHWSSFGTSLTVFAFGLVFTLLAYVAKLLTMNFLAQMEEPAPGASANDIRIYLSVGNGAIICGLATASLLVASVVCFLVGVLVGKHAIFG